ncbi:FHA domain-containing protein [Planctomicrobium piriforme]|nr:FHA domain-containing protein [Planctomicrobium piriforme]
MPSALQTLEVQTGKHKGRQIPLTRPETIIGRGEEARIRIPFPEVSREHCRLTISNKSVVVEDLKSRNGTFVDGRPVTKVTVLEPGSTLTIGPVTLLLVGTEPVMEAQLVDVALGGKSAVNEKISDDDIVSWISDAEIPTLQSMGLDTASLLPAFLKPQSKRSK